MTMPAAVPDVNTVLAKAAKPETVAVVTSIGEETARQSGKVFMQTVADDNGLHGCSKASVMTTLARMNLNVLCVCGGMTNCGATS